MKRTIALTAALLVGLQILANPADAATRRWVGGNNIWLDNLASEYWTPADEPDFDDTAYFATPDTVRMGNDNRVNAVTLLGGAHLSTQQHTLDVPGLTSIFGTLTVGGNDLTGAAGTGLYAGDITIVSGGALRIGGSRISYHVSPSYGPIGTLLNLGTVAGNGSIYNTDILDSTFSMFVNRGTLNVQSVYTPGRFIPLGQPATPRTLRIHASSSNARFDMDGNVEGTTPGSVNIYAQQTLDLDVRLSDPMSGSINLFHNSTLDVEDAWSLDIGTITVDNGYVPGSFFFPSISADVAYIRGGLFRQTGGTINIADHDGTLQFDAPASISGGVINNSGTVVAANRMSLLAGSSFTGGTLVNLPGSRTERLDLHASTDVDTDVINHGVLELTDASVGLVSIGGDFEQTSTGQTYFDLGGLVTGQNDQLAIEGSATLDGSLRVFTPSFTPGLGDTFTILTASSVAGEFSLIDDSFAGLIARTTFEATYRPNAVLLNVVPELDGDYDLDGDVDGGDFLELQRGMGTRFDANDLAKWRDNYGNGGAPALAIAAVPEPTSIMLLVLGTLAPACCRQR